MKSKLWSVQILTLSVFQTLTVHTHFYVYIFFLQIIMRKFKWIRKSFLFSNVIQTTMAMAGFKRLTEFWRSRVDALLSLWHEGGGWVGAAVGGTRAGMATYNFVMLNKKKKSNYGGNLKSGLVCILLHTLCKTSRQKNTFFSSHAMLSYFLSFCDISPCFTIWLGHWAPQQHQPLRMVGIVLLGVCLQDLFV